ncbi:MAG TPA: hypothetical protein DCO71_00595 [Gammaproteobacteria bacterium]|nr:hypothetical protein [Gammaproteobacteria bacterium]
MYRKATTAFAMTALITAALGLTSVSPRGEARSLATSASAIVNVNVSFDMQMPLAGDEVKTLSDAQTSGRKMIYRQAVTECPVLLETIAATCRLTRLNVSTRLNQRNHDQQQFLHLNGNAQFAITLRDTG